MVAYAFRAIIAINAIGLTWPYAWTTHHVVNLFTRAYTADQCEKQRVNHWGSMPIEVIN